MLSTLHLSIYRRLRAQAQAEQKTGDMDKIFTPAMNIEKPDLFMDYYFGSRTETMETFLNTVLDRKELYSNVHFDTFYKYIKVALSLNYFELRQNLYNREKNKPGNLGQEVIKRAWSECFIPGPRSLYESYRWRGETFGSESHEESLLFSEDIEKNDKHLTSIALLKTLDTSFAQMPRKFVGKNLSSFPTLIISSYMEDGINKARSMLYRLNRQVRLTAKRLLYLGKPK
jgi:hypothetical protein